MYIVALFQGCKGGRGNAFLLLGDLGTRIDNPVMVVMSQLLYTVANAVIVYFSFECIPTPSPQLYVAFCPDLTLRVFSEQFELLGTVNVTGTILR